MDGSELANWIVEHANESLLADQVADLLLSLIWALDCQDELLAETDKWLKGPDRRRIDIRLCMAKEIFPFADFEGMAAVLQQVSRIHPEFASRCFSVIAGREGKSQLNT